MKQAISITLRQVDGDLIRRAKSQAALSGKTLKQFVIEAIIEKLQKPLPNGGQKDE